VGKSWANFHLEVNYCFQAIVILHKKSTQIFLKTCDLFHMEKKKQTNKQKKKHCNIVNTHIVNILP